MAAAETAAAAAPVPSPAMTAAAAAKVQLTYYVQVVSICHNFHDEKITVIIAPTDNHHEPRLEKRYEECRSRCGRQEQEQYQKRECEQKCRSEFEKQRREHGDVANRGRGREYEEERERGRRNPYLFESERFESKVRTEQGHIKTLERFSKKSELLRGIDDYRLTILEADPNTFVLPHHVDAESVFFVVGGN